MSIKRGTNLPIAESVNKKLTEIARKMGGGAVRVGFLENSPSGTYPGGMNVASAALLTNFGHGGNFPSPPRPFFTMMIAKDSPNWPGMMGKLAAAYDYDGTKVLAQMGKHIEGELAESIVNTNEPPLSKTTLVLRAKFPMNPQDIRITDVLAAQHGGEEATGTGAKPLVWTGRMLRGIGSEVVKA